MNILVVDVAAESGGGLSVLQDFCTELKKQVNGKDHWYIAVGTPHIEDSQSISILSYPWIKKSWIHRLFFDYVRLPKDIKFLKIDKIVSLQNISVPFVSIPQILYVHNALPFVDYKFCINRNFYLWVYQNMIGKLIINSLKRANSIIVQSEWMKKACIEKAKLSPRKVYVIPPVLLKEAMGEYAHNEFAMKSFFYPSGPVEFKNHLTILKACEALKKDGIYNYSVIFTLDGKENSYSRYLHQYALSRELPVQFIGSIPRSDVFDYYMKSVLLFPSYIESSPLPLSEAKLYNTPILTSDFAFSREILNNYKNVNFFNAFDYLRLAHLMQKSINGNLIYSTSITTDVVTFDRNLVKVIGELLNT